MRASGRLHAHQDAHSDSIAHRHCCVRQHHLPDLREFRRDPGTGHHRHGIHCDDCVGPVTFPFPVTVYGTPYTTASVGSNGYVEFVGNNPNIYTLRCLPVRTTPGNFFLSTLFAYYDDLRTDVTPTVHGVFSSLSARLPTASSCSNGTRPTLPTMPSRLTSRRFSTKARP